MKTFKNSIAQGEIYVTRVDSLPKGLNEVDRENNKVIVAHSETGHHHSILQNDVSLWSDPNNPLLSFLEVGENGAELIHERDFDTHIPVFFEPGVYKIHRQREYTPDGWRQVVD